jgi:hypothetical protein
VPRADCNHKGSDNPRRAHICVKCGATIAEKIPEIAVQNGHTRPRRIGLEQELVKLAAQADGYSEDLALALWRQANSRVKPGDIHVRNRDQEIDHKLADVINHIVWSMEYFYDDYVEGDSDAADEFERYGRMLRRAMGVWRERHIGHP